jgi:hypothetical protein
VTRGGPSLIGDSDVIAGITFEGSSPRRRPHCHPPEDACRLIGSSTGVRSTGYLMSPDDSAKRCAHATIWTLSTVMCGTSAHRELQHG